MVIASAVVWGSEGIFDSVLASHLSVSKWPPKLNFPIHGLSIPNVLTEKAIWYL